MLYVWFLNLFNMRIIIVLLVVIFSYPLLAQDKIILLSGKVLEGKVTDVDSSGVEYEYQKKGKLKKIRLDDYRLYSIIYGDGKEEIIYKEDSLLGRNYSVREMGAFVKGERLAMEEFRGTGPIIYTFLLSSVAPVLMNGTIFAVPIPVVVAFTTLIPGPKINPDKVSEKDLLKEEYYLKGYQRVIRAKRLNRSVIAGFVGVGVGFGVRALIK